jgi:ADP-ribosylglycohydrolase
MNKWKSGIMGVVIGDALGCPVQFKSREEVARHPVTGMRGFGTFNLPAGSWTDDSSLTLALLESIRRSGGIDCVDIMDNFVRWLDDGAFTPYGYSYDVGGVTRAALQRYKRTGDPYTCGGMHASDNGNGSLMRIMPAVLYCIDKELPDGEAMDVIHRVGSLTHGSSKVNPN